jgi:hypothetical protein
MDIKNINISSFDSWERAVFAATLAGHNKFQIYCSTLNQIIGVLQSTPANIRMSLIPKYIRIVQTITKEAETERVKGQRAGVQHIIDSENHAKLWIVSRLLDAVYELMLDEKPKD